MARPARQGIQVVFAAALACGGAAAAPKHHVQEQDVTLDDSDDSDSSNAGDKGTPSKDEDGVVVKDEGAAAAEPESEPAEPAPKKKRHAHHEAAVSLEADMSSEQSSEDKQPEKAEEPAIWLSLGLMQDFAFLSGSNVCTEKSQVSGGFTCIRASGSQYHGTPMAGSAGSLGGIGLGPTRVTLGSYARVLDKVSLGLRLGYAFLGQGPQPDGGKKFLWFSGEAQGAYWLSRRAFSTKAVGTFIELSAGIAQVDAKSKVTVREDRSVPPPVSQIDNPDQQQLDAYKKSGAGFAGVGAGLFLPFATHAGLIADLRVIQLFPSSGTALSLGLSGALGL